MLSSQTEDAPSGFGTCEEGHGGGSDAGDQRGEEDCHLEGEDTAVASGSFQAEDVRHLSLILSHSCSNS